MRNIVKTGAMVALLVGASAFAVKAQSPRLDPSFALTSAGSAQGAAFIGDMLLQPDGKIVVSGDFTSINGRPAPGVARLLPDGQVDTAFAAPPINGLVVALALQADGKLLVGGRFTTVGGQSRVGLARLLPTGALDPGFLPPYAGGPPPYAYTTVEKIVVQPGRGILLLGDLITGTSPVHFAARLLEATGARDATFRPGFNTFGCNDVLVLPSGGLVFSGAPRLLNGQPCTVWATLPDGALDPAFVPLPGPNAPAAAYGLARDPATGELYVIRDAPTGTLDREPLRLRPDGVPDPAFRIAGAFPQAFGGAMSLAVQPNGRLLMGGVFSVAGGGYYGSARLLRSGALDASYDPRLGPGSGVAKALVQPDGKLLFAGYFRQAGGFLLDGLARMLDPNVLLGARAPGPAAGAVEAWPVPAREALHLRLPAGRAARHLALLDALGRVVLRQAVPAGQGAPVLPVAGLAPGGYLLRVDFAEGAPAYRRVAVE